MCVCHRSFQRRLGSVVSLDHAGADALFMLELERWQKRVAMQPSGSIKATQGLGGRVSFEARVANESPYDCAVLLLDPCLIVLAVCARASDGESRSESPINDRVVHEHAIVVEVHAAQRKR